MFDVTDNFALAIRLDALHISGGNGHLNVTQQRVGYLSSLRVEGDDTVSTTFKSERELWDRVFVDAYWLMDSMRAADYLVVRGLARRAELMRSRSDSGFEAMQDEFERTPLLIWDTVLKAMDGVYLAKAKLKPRRLGHKRGVSLWEVGGKVGLPHYGMPVSMAVRVFPSPIDDQAWLLRVQLPGLSADLIHRNQNAVRHAIATLEHLGIRIEDVAQGTMLDI